MSRSPGGCDFARAVLPGESHSPRPRPRLRGCTRRGPGIDGGVVDRAAGVFPLRIGDGAGVTSADESVSGREGARPGARPLRARREHEQQGSYRRPFFLHRRICGRTARRCRPKVPAWLAIDTPE